MGTHQHAGGEVIFRLPFLAWILFFLIAFVCFYILDTVSIVNSFINARFVLPMITEIVVSLLLASAVFVIGKVAQEAGIDINDKANIVKVLGVLIAASKSFFGFFLILSFSSLLLIGVFIISLISPPYCNQSVNTVFKIRNVQDEKWVQLDNKSSFMVQAGAIYRIQAEIDPDDSGKKGLLMCNWNYASDPKENPVIQPGCIFEFTAGNINNSHVVATTWMKRCPKRDWSVFDMVQKTN